MNALLRWSKFNLVGAMGMGAQLAVLALLSRCLPGHYLAATAIAVELALLHNFAWHRRTTWRDRCGDRRDGVAVFHQLVRFQLSNGAVSLAGNLFLMRLLVHAAHLPVLVGTVIAIFACSMVNFGLGDRWVFARVAHPLPRDGKGWSEECLGGSDPTLSHEFAKGWATHSSTLVHSVVLVLSLLLLCGLTVRAQTPPLPNAPQPAATAYHPRASDSYRYNVGVLCGVGASTSPVSTKPTAGCGAGITLMPLPLFVEVGIMAPQANRSYLTGYISVDGNIPLGPSSTKVLPLAIVGYSRLFETGHALDYGLALALPRPGKPKDPSDSLRIEMRDYWTFANPEQHNILLRVGWMSEVSD